MQRETKQLCKRGLELNLEESEETQQDISFMFGTWLEFSQSDITPKQIVVLIQRAASLRGSHS